RVEKTGAIIDLTVLADSVLVTGPVSGTLQDRTIFRRNSPSISLYLVYS
ncbi:MAG: hypothetical protein HYV96_21085, partial [Opitutae bacterium]|nr:hypothetical protein [Opitutae bacterium]